MVFDLNAICGIPAAAIDSIYMGYIDMKTGSITVPEFLAYADNHFQDL